MNLPEISKKAPNYAAMLSAIEKCNRADECEAMANQAEALRVYFHQVNDKATEIKLAEIKMRAWRKMGELFASVPLRKQSTQKDIASQIRIHFKMPHLKDAVIWEALKIAKWDFSFFNKTVVEAAKRTKSVATMFNRYDPELVKKRILEEKKAREYTHSEEAEENRAEYQARCEIQDQLVEAWERTLKEVGLTLKRQDRVAMKKFVFLMRTELHEALRATAHAHRTTMHEIIRRGLSLYFAAHRIDEPIYTTEALDGEEMLL